MAQDPIDPVVGVLLRSPLSPAQRRAASEAFTSSRDEDDLQERMLALNIPKHVRAELWDLKYAAGPQPTGIAPGPQGSALSRFLSNAGDEAANVVKGTWNALPIPQALGGSGVIGGPVNAAVGIFNAQKAEYDKAKADEAAGDTASMVGHSLAAAIPVIGPVSSAIGEQLKTGDIAGALGRATVGLAAPYVAGKLAGRKVSNVKAADAMRREAESIVSERVLAPANPKYKVPAQKAAPEILKRGVQGDRVAISQWADDLVSSAQQQIDDVIASYPDTDTLPTKGAADALDNAMAGMMYRTPKGFVVPPALTESFNALKKQRDFVSELGPEMSFADMRRLRQQMDNISKQAGAFSKVSGDRSLSAIEEATTEMGHALRRQIAESRPELAGPNADMHLGLAVGDILNPAKGRPKNPSVTTGATGGLHTTAAIIGSHLTDIPGLKSVAAFVASDLIPRIKNAQVSPENQLRLAQDKFQLAQALQQGKTSVAQNVMRRMALYVPGLSEIGRITTEPTPQRSAQ